ncbi:MAG: Hsp33 family molecular chaperone HslO [Peptococcaceae bacterium]|nr:Hsp33 family molecular chaperone HslO [Peptococcaceae bacterium]
MQNYLVRAVGKNDPVRIVAVTSTGIVEEARRRHGTSPVASAALGRTLTAGLMLATEMKGEDLLTIRILGDGPLGAIVVTADGKGRVRGYVQNPSVYLPSEKKGKLPVGTAVGKGMLYVSKDLGLKTPFVGSCELVSGEIAEDVAYYLYHSEQIPSALALGVLVETDEHIRSAGGIMVQVLGDADEETKEKLSQRFTSLQAISGMVDQGYKPEDIIKELKIDFEILDIYPVAFECRCTKQKVEETLVSLGVKELEDILAKEGQAEVRCHFCGENYIFTREELANLLKELKKTE